MARGGCGRKPELLMLGVEKLYLGKMPVSPIRPKGPPLNALRAFEAAARLGGFLAAAEELSVTPGAVSQQIKLLEGWAGAPLFERRAQGVVLTGLGHDVSREFSGAFDALGAAVRHLRAGGARRAIAIAALPSVAQLWLAPRMPQIRAALPGVEISISALETRPNLRREMFDISLFLDVARGGAHEVVLQQDHLFPVCAPGLAAGLQNPADLAGFPWMSDTAWAGDWAAWLAQIAPDMTPRSGPAYSLYSLAVDEAEAGAGVLMGHEVLVADRVAQGRLVAPFGRAETALSLNLETAMVPVGAVAQVVDLLRG